MPILQSCEILHQSNNNPSLQAILVTIKNDMEAGKQFAYSLAKFPRYFDALTCHLIHASEQVGTFAVMLQRIALHKEKVLHLKNKFKQALFYPTILSLMALMVAAFMLTFIVPRFAELFQSMHGTLPAFTAGVIGISDFIRNFLWLWLIPLCGGGVIYHYYKSSLRLRNTLEDCLVTLPWVGIFFQKIALTHFTRNLAMAFAAGIPIHDALKIIAPTCGNHYYEQATYKLQLDISKGQQLHRAMQNDKLFPNMLVQMVKIGEESGMLEQMLEKIAELYEADIDHVVITLSHLLEPLIMVILGVLIGGLVIAMYLPIFKLGTIL